MDTAKPGAVRQLRLVVSVPEGVDFDEAVAFYRDALGMPESESYEGEGDARVVILDAGRATLELSNPGQVRLIDGVETDGSAAAASAPLRVALEVADAAEATRTALDAGASLLAEPRETPWRSLNSRLAGPAALQLTLFEELDAE
ncbi:VOC family protein [Agromyces seonyuensis]|uniref:VOC family protein n=1 Tax=Agromyces seonyuensis TaxID=2662446 RepID=A0A6I4P5B8_9MICO|nr:VOC family protein [Agromyces seonyuensis]MWB98717.1 VOC family protein [Agromyces seonyuensis]